MDNALYIVWDEDEATGIPVIDEQYRSMVSMINTLYYFIGQDRGDEFLKPVMKMVEQFALLHFATQEEMMLQTGYEQLDEHRKMHQTLLENARQILYEQATPEGAIRALRFLSQWWRKHMNGEDKKFVEHCRKHGEFINAWNAV
ncbi:hypothetical protein GZ77_20830 [Endozoicomonas montiporae]|uniref:Hemerythrin-like domain-containing protein n=2 Tax=Endozoicomonas montiporae TaxID=1027273 RepID=A0A081N364_9GAMM|nr:hemerythrin family protein [Endozoicomonas montiporae]AMO58179.1 hemerythrin-like metal-binding protein [Endozoicomonas montiporae CL-33]KEQ12887.1 hypothetical protein GZ77_20830 [Endozoicomonas montiporae]